MKAITISASMVILGGLFLLSVGTAALAQTDEAAVIVEPAPEPVFVVPQPNASGTIQFSDDPMTNQVRSILDRFNAVHTHAEDIALMIEEAIEQYRGAGIDVTNAEAALADLQTSIEATIMPEFTVEDARIVFELTNSTVAERIALWPELDQKFALGQEASLALIQSAQTAVGTMEITLYSN